MISLSKRQTALLIDIVRAPDVCRSFHGAVKDREFTEAEVDRLARYQMATIEKVRYPV